MTWGAIVTNYHNKYLKEIRITDSVKTYIRTIAFKRILESIFYEHRCEETPMERYLGYTEATHQIGGNKYISALPGSTKNTLEIKPTYNKIISANKETCK